MAFDFKTATPESGIVDSNLLFGATSFAAIEPSVFPVSTLRNLLLGGGTLAITSGKTFTVTETMTLAALGSSQTYTFPATSGTVALLNAANIFSNPINTFGVQGTTRGTVVLANTNGGSNNLTLQSSNSNASAWTLTFPINPGTNTYALTTDGTGVSSWSQINLTSAVTGTLPVGNGGTGQTTLTVHGVLIGNATNGISTTSAGSAGQFLVSNGASADPSWTTATFPVTAGPVGTILRSDGTNWVATTATYPATTTSQQLLYSSANNVIGGLTNTNGGVLNVSSAGNISLTVSPTFGVQSISQGSLILANTNVGAYPTTIQSSNSSAAAWTLTLPVNVGSAGQPLITTDTSGTTAWSKVVLTQPATAATITIADNKTLTVSKTLTFDGTDSTTMTFPNTSTTVAGLGITQTFTGNNTFTGNLVGGSGTTTMTDGFIYIPAASGAPTGVPTAYANRVPFYYDTSDASLYVYNGAWTNSSYELTVGVTDINSGVNGRILYDNAGTLGEYSYVPVIFGGTGTTTAFTQGSVVFAGSGGTYLQDNSNFFWDDSNNRLGIGTATPGYTFHAVGTAFIDGALWAKVDGTTTSQTFSFGDGTTSYGRVAGFYDSSTTGHLSFYTLNSGSLTEWLRLTSTGSLQIYGSTSGSVTFKAPAIAGTTTFTLPSTNGTNGWLLKTDGSGNTSWEDPTALGVDLDVGTTAITNGVAGRILYQGATNVLQESAALTFATDTLTVGVSGTSTGYLNLGHSAASAFVQLSPVANATLQLGAPDAASPVAQTLQVQSVVAGTSNTSGVDFSIIGSSGTGTGNGGQIVFKTAPVGSTGSTQNTAIQAWAIDTNQTLYPAASQSTTMTKGFMNIPGGAGAPTGVPANTTGFPMYYDSTNNYLYVYNGAWKRVSFNDNFLTQE